MQQAARRPPTSQPIQNRTKHLQESTYNIRSNNNRGLDSKPHNLQETTHGYRPGNKGHDNRSTYLQETSHGFRPTNKTMGGRNLCDDDRSRNTSNDNKSSHIGVRPSKGLKTSEYSMYMTRQNCYVGMIFRSVHHEEDITNLNPYAPREKTFHTTMTVDHGDIYSKVRWMVVVKINHTQYTALPVFTFNGNGLRSKPKGSLDEYVSLQDLRVPGFTPQTRHIALEAEMLKRTTEIKPTAVVHMVANITKNFGLPIEEQGRLTKESKLRLIAMYNKVNRA